MFRPFWCNDSTTTLRTLDDWASIHGDLKLSPEPMKGHSLKRRARLRSRDQLLLQDLSDGSGQGGEAKRVLLSPLVPQPRRG